MSAEGINEFNGLITFLSSSLGLALVGCIWQYFRYRKMEQKTVQKEIEKAHDERIKDLEHKVADMDKSDTKFEGSLKRLHDRIDGIERSQDKLEGKIEKDLQEVKRSIVDLTSLVIKAISKGDSV